MSDAFFKAGMIMGELSSAVADLKKENADKAETIDEMAKLIDRQRGLLEECERAFNIIAGHAQCLDNLMGNRDVAEAMLARLREQEKADEVEAD